MSAFDVVIFICLIINTFFLLMFLMTHELMSFLRSLSFIMIVVAYISIITIYIVLSEIVERMYE
jgi:hypothetical protein